MVVETGILLSSRISEHLPTGDSGSYYNRRRILTNQWLDPIYGSTGLGFARKEQERTEETEKEVKSMVLDSLFSLLPPVRYFFSIEPVGDSR
jgi:hypothetical protein